jgi:hypothetical protein
MLTMHSSSRTWSKAGESGKRINLRQSGKGSNAPDTGAQGTSY